MPKGFCIQSGDQDSLVHAAVRGARHCPDRQPGPKVLELLVGCLGHEGHPVVQAFGAGQIDSLSLIYQRTVAFLAVHCCGLTLLVLSLPTILQAVGEDPGICHKVAIFSRALLPGVWFDILNRQVFNR